MQRWPGRECVIEQSQLIEERGTNDDPSAEPYRAQIVYSYLSDGKKLSSSRYTFDYDQLRSSNLSDVQSAIGSHPVGARTECFVNPKKPRESYLKKPRYNPLTDALLFIGIGAAFVLFALFSLRERGYLGRKIKPPSESELDPPAQYVFVFLFFGAVVFGGIAAIRMAMSERDQSLKTEAWPATQ